MGRLNARQARKKILAITGLFAMGAMLMLPIFTALPALAGGGGAKGGPPPEVLAAQKAAAEAAGEEEQEKVEVGRDVYYKTEGPVVGAPAPKTEDTAQ